jgi:hypothetical protein
MTPFGIEWRNQCPPKMRAASTKPFAPWEGFVAAGPSRVFRDGPGIFGSKLSDRHPVF